MEKILCNIVYHVPMNRVQNWRKGLSRANEDMCAAGDAKALKSVLFECSIGNRYA